MRIRWFAHSNRLNWIEIACLKNITEFRNTPSLNRPGNKEKKEEKGMEREEKLREEVLPLFIPIFLFQSRLTQNKRSSTSQSYLL